MPHDLIGAATHGMLHSPHLPGWLNSGSGYLASALVLATFCMGSMRSLRITALGSNVAFIFYAAAVDIRPVLILHSILLPVNAWRLMQIQIARFKAGRLLGEPDAAAEHAELGKPHFLSHAVAADPAVALRLAEREQERAIRLLVARLPGEAAIASGIDPQAAARAAPGLLAAIDQFLTELIAGSPSAEQVNHMAELHSRNELLRALDEALGELTGLIRQATPGRPAEIATMVAEGLATLLLHADEAVRTRSAEDVELLLRTTEDRSGLVERIRQSAVGQSAVGSAADYRAIYAITALYERAVWLLHRYASLLHGQRAAMTKGDQLGAL